MLLSFCIFLFGLTSLFSRAYFEATAFKLTYIQGFITCLRELTFCSTLYTTLMSIFYVIVSGRNFIRGTENDSTILYFMRLSSGVAESLIVICVLIGYLPFIPANPIIFRLDMIFMHAIIPLMVILIFIFMNPPIGKLKLYKLLWGLCFLGIYAVPNLTLIGIKVIPDNKIPYFFMDIRNKPIMCICCFLIIIVPLSYLISWALSELNRKNSWLWLKNLSKKLNLSELNQLDT